MGDERIWLWRALLVAVVATNTVFELSSAFGEWFGSSTHTDSLPVVVRQIVEARPDSDADLHGLMWFAAALLVMVVVRSWRARIAGLGALLAYTGALELLQTLTPSRAAEWVDMLGNAIGIAAAALSMSWFERRRLAARTS